MAENKKVKESILLIVLCVVSGVVGLFAYSFGVSKATTQSLAISTAAHNAYLSKRFAHAYEHEPAAIAIWEGTNLLSYLIARPPTTSTSSKEDEAERLFLNARLARLFEELEDRTSAQKCADEALKCFQIITTNKLVTTQTVVQEVLSRDHLKRNVK